MTDIVSHQARFMYNYVEFRFISIFNKFCYCCCKRLKCFQERKLRLERYQEASDKLNNEMDIAELIRSIRASDFVSQVYLKKHQLGLIPNFKEYQIVAVKQAKNTNVLPSETIQPTEFIGDIEVNFNPANDKIDRSILQKITGFVQSK